VAAVAAVTAWASVASPARASSCRDELRAAGVDFRPATRRFIDDGVEITDGIIGGVEYRGYRDAPLVLDCSLVVSLARAGRFLRFAGVERVTYSSAYQVRNIRGTRRKSRHSFGLAIDLHTFVGDGFEYQVSADYEQGLGDNLDCIGAPLTRGGAVLRTLACQMARSELFRIILTPDYDAGHWNHFHIEALPWDERPDR